LSTTEVDVLIVGAGLSGIGAACRLTTDNPDLSYEILEGRGASGGTWDLFRYPGVRSDTDMYTLGYPFRPWTGQNAIADGEAILKYLRDTAKAYGVDQRITYHTRAVGAEWSGETARWTVTVEDPRSGDRDVRVCKFLYLCCGYYRYDEGYTPPWPGRADFAGQVIHPQNWPADLDVTGKRVVVIGSGATAVTLVPALARTAAHVTMVQRSPSYVLSLPSRDRIAHLLGKVLPGPVAHKAVRWKNIKIATWLYQFSRRRPARMRAMLRKGMAKQLPAGYAVDTHFNPTYEPWDQRLCLVPDGDFFATIRSGAAEVVTDHIESFTPAGLRLRSGTTLDADVVITATGLNLLTFGGIALTVDGKPVDTAQRVVYKGMMLDGVPNMVFAIGYTNAAWTLKADLVATYVSRLLKLMRHDRAQVVTPRLPDEPLATTPLIEMSSGYFERSRNVLPRQADRAPWRLHQHYRRDAPLFRGPIKDDALHFDGPRVNEPAAGG
jgi:monooxygenase